MDKESVITELYDKFEQEKENSNEYNLILEEFNVLREKFDNSIREDQQKQLKKLFYLLDQMSIIEFKQYFTAGISKGIKLMAEVFCKEKTDTE